MTPLSAIYNQDFFEEMGRSRDAYRRMGDIVAEVFSPFHSVLDIGCGTGFVIERLNELGHPVIGIEGSECAPISNRIASSVYFVDITNDWPIAGKHDLVICTETAEHIDRDWAGLLVHRIVDSARQSICFSAARPGKTGHHHVNEQPLEYWVTKFNHLGVVVDEPRTALLRQRMVEVDAQHSGAHQDFLALKAI